MRTLLKCRIPSAASAARSRLSRPLSELAPDCCPVVAYGALIQRRHWPFRLRLDQLVPACYRPGAAPVRHAVLHGDDMTGASTFRLEEGLDTGPVYGVVTEPDRADGLQRSAARAAGRFGRRAARGDPERNRGGHRAAGAPRQRGRQLRPEAHGRGRADRWGAIPRSPSIDGLGPPRRHRGAWTTFRVDRIGSPVRPADDDSAGEPGQLHDGADAGMGANGDRPGRAVRRAAARKRLMSAIDWARGARISNAECLI